MYRISIIISIFSSFMLLLAACSTTKHVPEGEALLRKNSVEINEVDSIDDPRSLNTELDDLIQQPGNDRIFGLIPMRVWIYNMTYDTTKAINRFLRTRAGQAPVIYDSLAAERTVQVMNRFLFNKGYFNSKVSYRDTIEGQKAFVTYTISKRGLTWINDVEYEIENERMERVAKLNMDDRRLLPGRPYDVDYLLHERQRITDNMRNFGYYKFNKQYVFFEIDTLRTRDSLKVFVKIQEPEEDSVHHIYLINNVYIYPDFTSEDTMPFQKMDSLRLGTDSSFYIISRNLKYNPKALLCATFFKKGNLYSREDHELTINRLSDLGVFRFVNITFEEVPAEPHPRLDVVIKLIPADKKNITLQGEVNTGSDYLVGGELGVSYQNKNLFGYTDLFVLNLDGGVEADSLSANTVEINTDASIYFPKFLIPFVNFGCTNRTYNPKTRFSIGYNYFKRVQFFTLNSFSFQYGFDWNQFGNQRHSLNPLVINVVRRSQESPEFQQLLNENPLLRTSFNNQVILATTYTYRLNSRVETETEPYWYLQVNADVTLPGYFLYFAQSFLGKESNPFQLFGQNYSTYMKPDVEFIYHKPLSKRSSLVWRIFGGVGYAIGNSSVLPYIKKYNVGGSNSIRAFRIRSIGPGTYSLPEGQEGALDYIDQVGDVKLEGNVEYRFDITSLFEGALFLDAGNVWLLRTDSTKPGGTFDRDFYRELALGTGFGIRLDFNFFILRFDFGYPLYDPRRLPDRNPWVNEFDFSKLTFNLAIGYPF